MADIDKDVLGIGAGNSPGGSRGRGNTDAHLFGNERSYSPDPKSKMDEAFSAVIAMLNKGKHEGLADL